MNARILILLLGITFVQTDALNANSTSYTRQISFQRAMAPQFLAGRFDFVDDAYRWFNRSGGKATGPTYQQATREERRGERGFFYYVFQSLLRLGAGFGAAAMLAGSVGTRFKNPEHVGGLMIGAILVCLFLPWTGLIGSGLVWFGFHLMYGETKGDP